MESTQKAFLCIRIIVQKPICAYISIEISKSKRILWKNERILKLKVQIYFNQSPFLRATKQTEKKTTRNCIFLWTIPVWIELVHISPFNILTLWLESGNANRIPWWGDTRCVRIQIWSLRQVKWLCFYRLFVTHRKKKCSFREDYRLEAVAHIELMRRKFTLVWQRPKQ